MESILAIKIALQKRKDRVAPVEFSTTILFAAQMTTSPVSTMGWRTGATSDH